MSDDNKLFEAFVAGFRSASEGWNGEYTPPDFPEPWSEDMEDLLADDFQDWLNDD